MLAELLMAGSIGAASTPRSRHGLLAWFTQLGIVGLLLICAIDSSPIPLPIPGSSDLLVTVFAARHHDWLLATLIATAGSAMGAFASYQTGLIGGLTLMDRYVPARFADRLKHWAEHNALLSVAVPAILPPPAPLMPFLIAAGALRMPRRKYYTSFLLSRFVRHAFFAWLGVHFGRSILPVYNHLAEQYGWIILLVVWGSIAFAAVYAFVKLRGVSTARKTRTHTNAAAID